MDFEHDHRFEVMTSTALRGKAPAQFNWSAYYKTFERQIMTPRALAIHIYNGFAFTPVWHTARKEDNFISAGHLAFDFDTSDRASALDSLMAVGTFAWLFASFGYTTPSHTAEAPRSRLVFVLEYPIYDAAEYRTAYQAIAWKIAQDGGRCDPACKDPLRLYYGSPQCTVLPNWSVLATAALRLALDEYKAAHPIVTAKPVLRQRVERPSDNAKAAKIDQIAQMVARAPQGERHNELLRKAHLLGGYVAGAGISEHDAITALMGATSGWGDDQERERIIRDGLNSGQARPVYFEEAASVGGMLS